MKLVQLNEKKGKSMELNVHVLDGINYEICETQGNIYEYIANHGYDLREFSERYLKSDWTRRQMDTIYSRYQIREPEECLDFILPEIGEVLKSEMYFDGAMAFWIGFIYRALYLATDIPSEKLVQKVPFDSLQRMYIGYYTMDEIMQLEKIIENPRFQLM